MLKVKLVIDKSSDYRNKGLPVITHALPFYKSNNANTKYFHRVRSVNNHWLGHSSVRFWCGNNGFLSSGRGKLFSKIPDEGVLCAVCEGKAIGAGQDGARIINGRKVMYSPRNLMPNP